MTISKVQISSGHSFQGIKSGVTHLKPGDACDPSWGGGVIKTMTYSRDFNSIVVRKDRPFKHIDGKLAPFDALLIPFSHIEAIAVIDEAVEPENTVVEPDPPPAKPIQQQGRGR